MTDKQNFEKDINTPHKKQACDICGASYCNGDDCRLYNEYAEKEQECEGLKKIIDEAKNSKLDLKSFLVGEAVQNEYEQQLDHLKEQLEAYKMEAEEGKEINAELKAENKHLNDLLNQALKELEEMR